MPRFDEYVYFLMGKLHSDQIYCRLNPEDSPVFILDAIEELYGERAHDIKDLQKTAKAAHIAYANKLYERIKTGDRFVSFHGAHEDLSLLITSILLRVGATIVDLEPTKPAHHEQQEYAAHVEAAGKKNLSNANEDGFDKEGLEGERKMRKRVRGNRDALGEEGPPRKHRGDEDNPGGNRFR